MNISYSVVVEHPDGRENVLLSTGILSRREALMALDALRFHHPRAYLIRLAQTRCRYQSFRSLYRYDRRRKAVTNGTTASASMQRVRPSLARRRTR